MPFKCNTTLKNVKTLSKSIFNENIIKFKNNNAKIYLKSILTNLSENFFWTDINGAIVGCNDNQAKLFGLSSAYDLFGKTIYDVAEILRWDKSIPDAVRKNDLEVIQTCSTIKAEETGFFNGQLKTLLSFKNPLLDKKSRVIGVFGVSIDITKRKELEKTLKLVKEKTEAANYTISEFRKFYHKFNLTGRESECIYYMVRGMSAKQIGRIMALSNRTIESYLNNAKLKLGCKNKQELILKAFENGMI